MADDKNTNQNNEQAGKSKFNIDKKNLLLLGLIGFNIITMLAAAGIVFYTYINQPKKEGIVDVLKSEKRVSEVMKTESGEEAQEEDGSQVGPTFPLERFVVNLADKGGSRYLDVLVDLELQNDGLTEEIEKRLPQIRDAILLLLSSKRYEQISDVDGKKRLRDEIMHTLNSLLTTGRLKNVYFTKFVINE